MLERDGWNQEKQHQFFTALKTDYTCADLSPADRAMLGYAVKLTKRPADITAEDIQSLRAEGFDDRAIHDICAVTGYFAFSSLRICFNAIQVCFGIKAEPAEPIGHMSRQPGEFFIVRT